jgi:hypothetical protein
MTPKIVAPVCTSESIEGVEVVAVLDERCAIVRTRLDNPLQPGDQLELATR